jgi:3-hydroxyisobutyrate dehydrogenase-like beta-hydroxyacid dehydrogenase
VSGPGEPGTANAAAAAAAGAVGFIGLGQMGAPMAARLTGWPGGLVVHDVRAAAMAPLALAGARQAASPAEVAEAADLISVMVRDDSEVRAVVLAIAGAVAPTGRQVVAAIHSTIGAGTAPDLAAQVGPAGVQVVDAPVSGGLIGASDGRLAVMVGGPPEAFELCREPFGRWADLILHMGAVGAGTKAKLARNLLHFVSFTAAAEAQRLAEAAGLDLRKLTRVVRHSDAVTGGAGSIMLRPTTSPMAADDPLRAILEHVRDLGEKDLRLALGLGTELGVDLPMAEIALGLFASGLGLPEERNPRDG